MKLFTRCALLVVLVTVVATAQWTLIHPYPQNSSVEDIQFVDAGRGWFVTAAGTIWHTTDGGVTWTNQRKATTWGLKSLSFTDPLNGWAGGRYEPLLRTTNGGMTWYSLGFVLSTVSRLKFLTPSRGFAATETGGVLRSASAGASWDSSFQWPLEFDQDVWVPPGPIIGLSVVDSSTAWIIGERVFRRDVPGLGNIIARTTNGGLRWDTIRINFPGHVTDIHFVSKDRGWYLADSASIIGTSDGGASWQREFGPLTSLNEPLSDITGVGGSSIWAVGKNGLVVRTTNGGASWSATTIDSITPLHRVAFLNTSQGWCAGEQGEVFRSTDGGVSWTKLSRGGAQYFRAVEFVTPMKGWAASGWFEGAGVFHSTDGGFSWIPQLSFSNYYFNDVEMLDTLLGWSVGSIASPFKLFKTTDGGQTWQQQSLSLRSSVQGVVFADPRHGWIYGDYIGSPGPEYQVIHRTTDGGTTWSAVLVDTNQFSPTVGELWALDSLTAWCVNQYGVFRTLDGGASWNRIFNDSPLTYKTSITFVNATHGWICGSGGLIMRTTDGGLNWSVQSSPTRDQLMRIRFADAQRGWAVGLGSIVRTTDGGQTWLRDSVETYPYMFDLSILPYQNRIHAWAVGSSGTVFKHESPLTDVGETMHDLHPSTFALHQNYPNPFNPSTTISFSVPGSTRRAVSLRVYDVLGREVATLVDGLVDAGRTSVQFDAGNLPSGVYFYRLGAGSYSATKKMLLIR